MRTHPTFFRASEDLRIAVGGYLDALSCEDAETVKRKAAKVVTLACIWADAYVVNKLSPASRGTGEPTR